MGPKDESRRVVWSPWSGLGQGPIPSYRPSCNHIRPHEGDQTEGQLYSGNSRTEAGSGAWRSAGTVALTWAGDLKAGAGVTVVDGVGLAAMMRRSWNKSGGRGDAALFWGLIWRPSP